MTGDNCEKSQLPYHSQSKEAVLQELNTTETGLILNEAASCVWIPMWPVAATVRKNAGAGPSRPPPHGYAASA